MVQMRIPAMSLPSVASVLAVVGGLDLSKQKTRRVGFAFSMANGGEAIVNMGSFVDGEFIDRITLYNTPTVAPSAGDVISVRFGFFNKPPADSSEFSNGHLFMSDGNPPTIPSAGGFAIFPVNAVADVRRPIFAIRIVDASAAAGQSGSVWIDTVFPS